MFAGSGVRQPSAHVEHSPVSSTADELAKLLQLKEAGAMSDAEFEHAKARLLGL